MASVEKDEQSRARLEAGDVAAAPAGSAPAGSPAESEAQRDQVGPENRPQSSSTFEGLHCVWDTGRPAVKLDIIFVQDFGGHPLKGWGGPKYVNWPRDLLPQDLPDARAWWFAWNSDIRYNLSLSSVANKLALALNDMRMRDEDQDSPQRHNVSPPRIAFVTGGLGGIIVKKVLIDCRLSGLDSYRSIWETCTGLILLGVPHLPRQDDLRKSAATARIARRLLKAVRTVNTDPMALIAEIETTNQQFLKILQHVSPTLCVVQITSKTGSARRTIPTTANATFASRSEPESNLSVTTEGRLWDVSNREAPLYRTTLACLRKWQTGPFNPVHSLVEAPGNGSVIGPRLLSIDGGGVRGLCSLLVMESLMQEVKKLEVQSQPESKDWPRLPCRYFDLTGGTSTGGLIAIMLFRLRMDTRRAIYEYKRMSPEIFKSGMFSPYGTNAFKAIIGRPWFKGRALEKAVQRVVEEQLPDEERQLPGIDVANASLLPSSDALQHGSCKMFACALMTKEDINIRFRNYLLPDGSVPPFANCAIWEAARATSAAPFYFPAAKVNGIKFWDGGLENNNPVDEVWAEKGPGRPACVISLGTGASRRKGTTKSWIPAVGIGKRILRSVTQVEGRHRNFKERMENEEIPYFRFNPSTADDNIGLAEYQKFDKLEQHTLNYLQRDDVQSDLRECARILVGQKADEATE